LEAFERAPSVDTVFLLLPQEWIPRFRSEILSPHSFSKLQKILPGGKTRQDSTLAGFKDIEGPYDVVLVHDGARPLIDVETIDRCVQTAYQEGAALVASPSRDTVKQVDAKGWVQETLDRRQIYLAQTPQAARYAVLKEALEKAQAEGFQGTDEASLIERIGVKVRIVECDTSNLKVTTALDFKVAEALLKQREGQK